MPSLFELTKDLEPGDYLAWVGENSRGDVERVFPKEASKVQRDGDTIHVNATGIRGGEYFYKVSNGGESEAFFVHPNKEASVPMGPVFFAEITDSQKLVQVTPGFTDNRGD